MQTYCTFHPIKLKADTVMGMAVQLGSTRRLRPVFRSQVDLIPPGWDGRKVEALQPTRTLIGPATRDCEIPVEAPMRNTVTVLIISDGCDDSEIFDDWFHHEVKVPEPLTPVIGLKTEELLQINPYDLVPTCD